MTKTGEKEPIPTKKSRYTGKRLPSKKLIKKTIAHLTAKHVERIALLEKQLLEHLE